MAFVSNPSRDAGPTIAGFFLQVNVSIVRWLNLGPSQRLELECGEDIDTVDGGNENLPEKRLLEQLKLRNGRSLTLRSVEGLDALANYATHVRLNQETQLLFRYLTTAVIGVDIGWTGAQPAIATWQAIREGEYSEESRSEAIAALSSFLGRLTRPPKISESAWNLLQSIVTDKDAFLQLILSFDWAVGQPGLEQTETQIRSLLLRRGYASKEEEAGLLYEHLVAYIFRSLSKRGRRPLTLSDLAETCARPIRTAGDAELIALIRAQIAENSARLDEVESSVAMQSTELATLQQAVQQLNRSLGLNAAFAISAAAFSTEVPEHVTPRVSRSRVVRAIRDKLNSLGVSVLVAEPGSGKTQLLLLVRDEETHPFYWLNIPRDSSEAQACILLEAFIRSLSLDLAEGSFRDSLDAAAKRLENAIVSIEDLPRALPGGRLAARIDQLQQTLSSVGGRFLASSYYRFPATLEDRLGDIHYEVPRFDSEDVVELMQVASAPEGIRTRKIADFLITATQGLPVLVVAAVRYLASRGWSFTLSELEPVFRGEFAEASRRDAQELLRVTIPDTRERELIIRMSLAIGPFSSEDIARVAKVPSAIPLPGEIVRRSTGVWLQKVGQDRYLCSPLIGPALADALDFKTRRGVHFVLGARTLARGTITPVEAFAAVNHFTLSLVTTYAVLVTINMLSAYMKLDEPFTDEFSFSRRWPNPLDRSEVDLNLELYLRSMQIVVAAKLGRDIEPQLALFDTLLQEADYTGWGVAIGAGTLAIHLVWKFSASTSKYLLYALNSFPSARLPDGSSLPVRDHPMEILALMSAHTCKSDADLDAWLSTIKRFTKTQLNVLASSELAEDNVVIVCDGIWNREFEKSAAERDWTHAKAKLVQVQEAAKEIGFPLLEAAAIRGRIVVLAEFEERLEEAMQLSADSLNTILDDTPRFLLLEVTGRQLVIADKDDEGRKFLLQALSCNGFRDALLRRNVFVVLARLQDGTSSPLPKFYTLQAVEIARGGKLNDSIIVGTLAEHGIAQWRSGDRGGSLSTLSEAVDVLLKIREETVAWKALFYQVFSVLTAYSDLAHEGSLRAGFAEPRQGWFTASHEDLANAFRTEQVAYICVRVAKFADGIREFERAAQWIWRSISLAEGHEGWDVVCQFVQYGLPWELLNNQFERAGKLCALNIRLGIESLVKSREPSAGTGNTEREQLVAAVLASAPVPAMSLARVRTAIPIAFRVATLVVQGSALGEIEAAVAALEAETDAVNESEGFAGALRHSFIEATDGKTLTDEAVVAFNASQYVKAETLMVGAIVRSSPRQSLYLQVRMMETLPRLFSGASILFSAIVAPFFVEYWRAQASRELHPFRTAQAHTLRQLELSDGTVAGVRKLLSAMRFCLGTDLPEEAMAWLVSGESK